VLTSRKRLHAGFDVAHDHVLVLVAIERRYTNCKLERSNAAPASAVPGQNRYRYGLVAYRWSVTEDAIRAFDEASHLAVQEARQIRRPVDPRVAIRVQRAVASLAALLARLSSSARSVDLDPHSIHFQMEHAIRLR
jgi:hypothetical protein